MAWQIDLDLIESCSCKLLCACWTGPQGEPDHGWCASALAFDIERGSIDGVDVAGRRVVVNAEWPGNFFAGNGAARLYLDASASADQRRELEAVFGGKKGGLLEGLWSATISKWLPSKVAPIDVKRGDVTAVTVGDIGNITLKLVNDLQGHPALVQGMPTQAAFQSTAMNLASSKGTRWADADMRRWEGDSGTMHRLHWTS
jgi:hypothetical protein